MGLRLGDLEFEIKSAKLHGWLNAHKQNYCVGLGWELIIDSVEREIGEDYWQPQFSLRFPSTIKRWTDLEGLSLSWDESNRGAQDIEAGYYDGIHDIVPSGEFKFASRAGATFGVEWTGVAEVWSERFGKTAPFALECAASFTEITASGDRRQTGESLTRALAAEIALDGLGPAEVRTIQHRPGRLKDKVAAAILPWERDKWTTMLADFRPGG